MACKPIVCLVFLCINSMFEINYSLIKCIKMLRIWLIIALVQTAGHLLTYCPAPLQPNLPYLLDVTTDCKHSLYRLFIPKVPHLEEKLLATDSIQPVNVHIRNVVWFLMKCCVSHYKKEKQYTDVIQQFALLCTNTPLWHWNETLKHRLHLVTLQRDRGLFVASFPADHASFSITSHLMHGFQGKNLIPTGYGEDCSPFSEVVKWFFLDFITTV